MVASLGKVFGRLGRDSAARLASHGSLVAVIALLMACGDDEQGLVGEGSGGGTMDVVAVLAGADTAGFARATTVREFDFPADHGAHPEYRTEWWYLTGNLTSGERRFGYQFTIFRSALAPGPAEGESAWSTNQAYMAHLAVTDVDGGAFFAFDRFARGAVGLAGAEADPFRVWIEDWEMAGEDGALFPLRVRADADSVALDLFLEEGKPMVLHGDRGLSQKGPGEGNASYYYSYTRIPTSGTVSIRGDTSHVEGDSWFDREWSTSLLADGMVGWDWFALQLDNGFDIMLYQLRLGDGTSHPMSHAVLIDPQGRSETLKWGESLLFNPTETWSSPVDGTTYPAGWEIALPNRDWTFRVTPALSDQELKLAFRYWEGAIIVEGVGESPRGRGYAELTGYAPTPLEGGS